MRSLRSGFSLIEALVVLAVGGMALAIIFSIGVKAGDTGFSLGRRAMSAAERDIAVGDLRATIRSLNLTPAAFFNPEVDRPVRGDPVKLEGNAVMERATPCAPLGWAGSIVLTIEPAETGVTIFCEAAGRKIPLASDTAADAAFSYSPDGKTWSSRFDSTPSQASGFREPLSEQIFIRFHGSLDVVELVQSNRPERWLRPDALV